MKLNLWIIANRLYELEPELHIPEDAPLNLRSARRVYATSCVYVFQKGSNVICDAGTDGGYIVFKDTNCDQAFDLVQSTFDFFDDWLEEMLECIDKMDLKKIVDRSWSMFHNPILLLDAGNHLLARSPQYGENDVNYDWRHLCQHGISAVSVIQYLMEAGKNDGYYTNERARIYQFPEDACVGTELSVAIYSKDALLGRMNIIEKDRKLNPGDLYLADFLVKFFSQILVSLNETKMSNRVLYPVLSRMLLGQFVSLSEMNYWKEYTQWNPDDDFQVIVMELQEEDTTIERTVLICNLLQNAVPSSIVTQVEKNIAFIYRYFGESYDFLDRIDDVIQKFHLIIGISCSFHDIDRMQFYYDQASTAISLGKIADQDSVIHKFYSFAIDYIILSDQLEKSVCAAHPDIVKLWDSEADNGGSQIETLSAYLDCDRSLIHASRKLFIHRSTLVYRLGKISDRFIYDMDDGYTRDYMKLSVRILRLYFAKKSSLPAQSPN